MDGWQHAWAVAAVFVIAGGVKGITGMGLPTVAVSLLGLWMAPAQAAALLVAPSLATNVAQCRGRHFRALVMRLWPAWLAFAGAALAAPAMGSGWGPVDPHRLLGGVLVLYGAWGLWRPVLPDLSRHQRLATVLGVAAGALTGWMTAATAVFVVPLVPYLQALRLDKDAMVQALGLSFTLATIVLAVRLQGAGTAQLVVSASSSLALAAAFAGLGLGAALRSRLSGPAFQRGLFLVFVGLGAANLLRGP